MTTVAAALEGAPPLGTEVTSLPPGRARSWSLAIGALATWCTLVWIASAWGEHLLAVGRRLQISAPPLTGTYDWRVGVDTLPALFVGAAVVIVGPRVARDASWRGLLVFVALGSLAWAASLAVVDGWGALTDALPGEYLGTVSAVGNPFDFTAHFISRISGYSIDTQGHPPGMVLLLWSLDRVGLSGVGWNAVLVFLGGAAGALAALVALREVAGEDRARTAAPFLVVVPAAIWWTSGDAFYIGVAGWAATLVVLATGRAGRRADLLALSGGVLFGVTAFLSYGLVLLAVIPMFVAISRRRLRPVLLAAVGTLPLFVAFLGAGFWWISGLEATRRRYFAGVASRRPYNYFLLADLAAFALALGPAVAVALVWLRDRKVWLLVGAGLTIVAIADLSGMSKAEVERIWLPFVPWVMLATAAFGSLHGRSTRVRPWLMLQVASGLLIEVAIRSPW